MQICGFEALHYKPHSQTFRKFSINFKNSLEIKRKCIVNNSIFPLKWHHVQQQFTFTFYFMFFEFVKINVSHNFYYLPTLQRRNEKKMKITERQKAPIRKITVGISQGSFWDWNKYQEKKMLTSLRLKI